ncbi:hypothetical protein [Pseudofrankia sp. BMG5.36]|uniref:hypothetical protein n=1 Tax=Pseudofrankia sp. BMG5.36 TaxID=1834512 RepID=UPI001042043A|nr:hypothetical protein [Pseudofrankia sp. BMG5.36]
MMSQEDRRDSRHRIDRHLGRAKTVWAAVAGVLAATASVATIWHYYGGSGNQRAQSFSGDLNTRAQAHAFIQYLTTNDQTTVRLSDVICHYSDVAQWCADDASMSSYSGAGKLLLPHIPDDTAQYETVHVNGERDCRLPDASCSGTYLVVFRIPVGVDAHIGNGKYGAGTIVANGNFSVSVIRNPAGFPYTEVVLTGRDAPNT